MNNIGTYAKIVPSAATAKFLYAVAVLLSDEPIAKEDIHCTVLYSKTEVQGAFNLKPKMPIIGKIMSFDLFGDDKECLVVKIDCPGAKALHDKCIAMGGTHDFDSYECHITLSYDADYDALESEVLERLEPSLKNIPLIFDKFESSDLEDGWSDDK